MPAKPRIMGAFPQYCHGIPALGENLEKKYFEPELKKLSSSYLSFHYDGLLNDLVKLQKEIITSAKRFKPDIIFFSLMKDEFSFETIDKLRAQSITINWFSDDQWRYRNFSSHVAPHFSLVATTDKASFQKYQSSGIKAVLTGWGAGEIVQEFRKNRKYSYDVSFIGGKDKTREEMIHYLKQQGIDVSCFGRGWKAGIISDQKMAEVIAQSKINLNLSNSNIKWYLHVFQAILTLIQSNRVTATLAGIPYLLLNSILRKKEEKLNKGYTLREQFQPPVQTIASFFCYRAALKTVEQIKARHFEIPALGGFQLSFDYPDIDLYYKKGKEIAVFTSKEDLVKKIQYYLTHEEEREQIAYRSWKKTKEFYSYPHIIHTIISEAQKIKK